MSVQAMSWAFKQPIQISSAKFVLVVLANCADADMICWPSRAHVAEATGQDRKTVIENIHRLLEWGYVVDTGERKGVTKQIAVYQLKTPEPLRATALKHTESGMLAPANGPSPCDVNSTVNGMLGNDRNDPESGTLTAEQKAEQRTLELELNGTESGTVNDDLNGTEIGMLETVPKTEPYQNRNCSVFPAKGSRFSRERVPKTGHGTINEPSMNHKTPISPLPKSSVKKKKAPPEPENPEAFEKFWKAYPKKIRKPSAIAAFNELNPDGALLETIIGAIEKGKRSEDWKKAGGKYILGPVRYLNEEAWNDVIEMETKPDKYGWDANLGRHVRPNL